ncbi:MAG: glycosyl transferase family 1 [Dehalococcoidia bacterium]|nr:MAG: glycosyl transferase family 1 [Dehalococcoidia bacterium]
MRLAMVTPLPPEPTGIADYSAELAPALGARCDLTLYSAHPPRFPRRAAVAWRPVGDFRGPAGANGWDVALYQMGNNVYHEPVYRAALRWPGVVVLHDPVVHHFVSAITEHRGDGPSYIREMLYSHGVAGARAARGALRRIRGVVAEAWPLTGRLVDFSLGVIVHSEAAATIVRQVRPEAPIAVVPHLVAPPPRISRRAARRALGLPESALLFGVFGLVTREKRLDTTVRALNVLASELADWRLVIVGDDGGALEEALALASADVRERTILAGRVDWRGFTRALAAVDIAIALRWPTLGETSGAALRSLASGTPLVASAVGAFRELPEAVALVPPEDDAALIAALRELALDPDLRAARGEASRRWAAEMLAPDAVAARYLDAIARFVS